MEVVNQITVTARDAKVQVRDLLQQEHRVLMIKTVQALEITVPEAQK